MTERPPSDTVTDLALTRAAVIERLRARTGAAGNLSGPCVPALSEHYLGKLIRLFEVIDRSLSAEEVAMFRDVLQQKLEQGFQASPYARFVLAYEPSQSSPGAVSCSVSVVAPTLEEQYDEWLRMTGTEQPFGSEPDAMVVHVAGTLPAAPVGPILDVGAGAGRNALALARLGFSVHALEPHPVLAETLRAAAARHGLPIEVLAHDVLSEAAPIDARGYAWIVASEILPHLSASELERALEKLAHALAPGGTLLVNAFVTKDGYVPDDVARQAAQGAWSTFTTRAELGALLDRLGLAIAADESCVEYERAHLPLGAWPPTRWYENWANGHNLFSAAALGASAPSPSEASALLAAGAAPIELRWIQCRKPAR